MSILIADLQYMPNNLYVINDVATSTVTVTNTVTETTIYTAQIPADLLVAGNVIEVKCFGVITNATAADDITINVYIGSTLLESFNPAIGNVSGANFDVEYVITVRSIGGAGSLAFHGQIDIDTFKELINSIQTIDTTAAEDITVKVQWDNAKLGNTISLQQGITTIKRQTQL